MTSRKNGPSLGSINDLSIGAILEDLRARGRGVYADALEAVVYIGKERKSVTNGLAAKINKTGKWPTMKELAIVAEQLADIDERGAAKLRAAAKAIREESMRNSNPQL